MKILKTGQQQLENDLLAGGALENWQLALFGSSHAPAVTDTLATFNAIESTFTGYARKTLTRSLSAGTWSTPALTGSTIDAVNHNAISSYGAAAQSWSVTSAGSVYGYYLLGVTSAVGIAAEQFGSPVTLYNPSTLQLTPNLELGAN